MKKLIAFVLVLICVLPLVGCADQTMTFDIGRASMIHIKCWSGKEHEMIIADDEFTRKITEDINSLRFEKTSETDGNEDYTYILTWLDAEEQEIESITITEENGHQISRDGYYYKVADDLCIDVALIAEQVDIALSSGPAPVPEG